MTTLSTKTLKSVYKLNIKDKSANQICLFVYVDRSWIYCISHDDKLVNPLGQ